MSNTYAVIEDGIVTNIILSNTPWPNSVNITERKVQPGIGWLYDGNDFTQPAATPEVVPEPQFTPFMTQYGFLSRLTPQERMAVRVATTTDPVLDDAMFLFNSAGRIDVTLMDTQMLVGYLAQQGHVTPSRVAELLAPISVDSPHATT